MKWLRKYLSIFFCGKERVRPFHLNGAFCGGQFGKRNKMNNLKLNATKIVKILQDAGHEAVFAGGCVRDMLLEIEPHDFDIATSALPDQVESLFKNTKAVGKAFGVILVRLDKIDFEVATFRSDGNYSDGRRPDSVSFTTMENDSDRRDFTVNSMFLDPIKEHLFDFNWGERDIENKVIRFVGDEKTRIQEDNLRLLRAVRFAVKFDFNFDFFTFKNIKFHAHLVKNVSPERIREELVKMFLINKPRRMMELLMSTGLMEHILPEVKEMDMSLHNLKFHPEGDVLEHTIIVMEKLVGRPLELQFAGLFHDIGKPSTMVMKEGQPTNHGHAEVGAEIAEEIMLRLKFSNKEIELVKNLVGGHMKMNQVRHFKKSTIKRYLALPYIEDLISLAVADAQASTGDMSQVDFIRDKLEEWEPEEIKPVPILTGKDLIGLGIKPGPIFKEILNEIETLQLEGIIVSVAEAIYHVMDIMKIKRG